MSVVAEKLVDLNVLHVFKTLKPIFSKYQGRFLFGLLLILLSTLVDVVSPVILGRTVDAVVGPTASKTTLYQLCAIYFGLVLSKFILDGFKGYIIQSTGERFSHSLRKHVFARIEGFTISYFDRNPVGRSLTRVINDIKNLGELFTADISVIVLDVMLIGGSLIAMFAMDWKLAACVLATFPFVFVIVGTLGKRLAFAYRRAREKLSAINAFLGENIGAIATIQRLAAEAPRMSRFKEIVDAHNKAQIDSVYLYATIGPLTNLLNGIAMGTLLIVGGYWAVQEKITIGVVVAFIGFIRNIFFPIRDLVEKYNMYLSAKVSAERVVSLLEEDDEMKDGSDTQIIPKNRSIEFKNIIFRYLTREENAVTDVNFMLPEGKSMALVGTTGSGKSTLVRLLMRFYDPTKGEIIFGGYPIHRWNKRQLRRQLGVVHQEIYLMAGTLRENLTLDSAEFADEILIDFCQRAQLWDFIKDRGGLDLKIEEGGSNLSIGEKQLISFARILVFNPPVLILDEATASIDRISERNLMTAVEEIMKDRTTIVVAHRLSTIRKCHKILVMEQGKVLEQGTYDELLAINGKFRRFHDLHELA